MITSTLQWHKAEESPEKDGIYLVAGYEITSGEKTYTIIPKFFIGRWTTDFCVEFWSPLPEYPREV